jgi:hypothetical protein
MQEIAGVIPLSAYVHPICITDRNLEFLDAIIPQQSLNQQSLFTPPKCLLVSSATSLHISERAAITNYFSQAGVSFPPKHFHSVLRRRSKQKGSLNRLF